MNNTLASLFSEAKNLNITIRTPAEVLYYPKSLEKVVQDLLLRHNSRDFPGVERFDFDELNAKIMRIYEGKKEVFSYYDTKCLPFMLYSYKEVEINKFIIKSFNNGDRINKRVLIREIYTYIRHYDYGPISELVRSDIISKLQSQDFNNKKLHIWRHNSYIFEKGAHNILGEQLAKRSITSLVKDLCFDSRLLISRLFIYSVLHFINLPNVAITTKMERFEEIYKHNFCQTDLLAKFADCLIPAADEENDDNVQNRLRTIFYQEFGDPRYIHKKYKWNYVSERAKNVFMTWLAKFDINLFFEIIKDTLSDSSAGSNMWRYRQKFWLAYLPYIKNTWVFLGPWAGLKARRIRQNQTFVYGKLSGGGKDRSAIIFEIGNYIFIEQSHNGKLRIWKISDSPVKCGARLVYYDEILNAFHGVVEFIHSSPKTYNWQEKVRDWIAEHCYIYTNKDDWRI
jgi:hypothetical protein